MNNPNPDTHDALTSRISSDRGHGNATAPTYRTPSLRSYGSVSSLTLGATGSINDFMKMQVQM